MVSNRIQKEFQAVMKIGKIYKYSSPYTGTVALVMFMGFDEQFKRLFDLVLSEIWFSNSNDNRFEEL